MNNVLKNDNGLLTVTTRTETLAGACGHVTCVGISATPCTPGVLTDGADDRSGETRVRRSSVSAQQLGTRWRCAACGGGAGTARQTCAAASAHRVTVITVLVDQSRSLCIAFAGRRLCPSTLL